EQRGDDQRRRGGRRGERHEQRHPAATAVARRGAGAPHVRRQLRRTRAGRLLGRRVLRGGPCGGRHAVGQGGGRRGGGGPGEAGGVLGEVAHLGPAAPAGAQVPFEADPFRGLQGVERVGSGQRVHVAAAPQPVEQAHTAPPRQ